MALIWCDGFEGYADTNNEVVAPTGIMATKYGTMGAENRLRAQSSGRNDWSIRWGESGYSCYARTPAIVSGNTAIAGVAVKLFKNSGWQWDLDWPLLCFRNTSNVNAELICASGHLFVNGPTSGTNYLGGTRVNLELDVWHYVEMKVYCHATTGTIEVRVNGCPVFTYTGNTVASGGATTRVGIGDNHPMYDAEKLHVDDFYVCDGTGSKNNDFLGDVTVRTLWPDGDDTTQFATTGNANYSTHYEQINHTQVATSTDYVQDNTTGNRDKFTLDNPTDNFATIHGIMVWSHEQDTGSGNQTYRNLIDSNGTESESSNHTNASWAYDGDVWEDNPDTASAWTNTTINALKSGFEVQ